MIPCHSGGARRGFLIVFRLTRSSLDENQSRRQRLDESRQVGRTATDSQTRLQIVGQCELEATARLNHSAKSAKHYGGVAGQEKSIHLKSVSRGSGARCVAPRPRRLRQDVFSRLSSNEDKSNCTIALRLPRSLAHGRLIYHGPGAGQTFTVSLDTRQFWGIHT